MCQNINSRVNAIQEALTKHSYQAIVIPSSDPHQSEYLPDHWKIREWICGFTGSAGTVVITTDEAGLWTDSRYYLQAEEQLSGTGITLFRAGEKDVPSTDKYLQQMLPEGSTVVMNSWQWSQQAKIRYQEAFSEKNIAINDQLRIAEEIWDQDGRPELPAQAVFIHPEEYAVRNVDEKLVSIRSEIKKLGATAHLITTLDDIAWTLNLRGYDVEFNPVFLSYLIIREKEAILFIDDRKVTPEVRQHLDRFDIRTDHYEATGSYLSSCTEKILVNDEDCNAQIFGIIPEESVITGPTPSRLLKACKTGHEIRHIENAMIKDGIALAKAFYSLFQRLHSDPLSEAEFAALIAEKRSEQEGYYGESFPAIVGYQANGAIVHYRPEEGSSKKILPEGLLLCDSGGQYMDGTTDITRTMAVGPVSQEQRESYTRVLKGHIAIDQAIFPEGTTGGMLDILARQFLWKSGQNFGHGTGHGVGYFLNVHEPPQGISPGPGNRATTAFQPGMLTSNEPGYYEDGSYGIRIENLIVTEKSKHEGYLKHRHLTLFPIDTSLIVDHMMTRGEVKWINNYHELVASKIVPHLEGHVKKWMEQHCRPI